MAIDYTTPAEALSETTTLFNGLIVGLPTLPTLSPPPDVTIPDVGALPADLTTEIDEPVLTELTEGQVSGDGVFDKLMVSLGAHIEGQYNKGIIGKSDVAAVYIAAIQATLPQSIQFLLSKNTAFWQAKLVQIQAQNAYLERTRLIAEIMTAKLVAYRAQADAYTAQVNAITAQSNYALSKLNLSKALQEINNLEAQQYVTETAYEEGWVKTHETLSDGITAVAGHTSRDWDIKEAALVTAQKQADLLAAQTNVQRAQTYDTNTDATTVAGVIGKQKELYTQQIESYQLDGQNKGVKMIADLWTSAKALDDAVQSPGPLAGNLMLAMNEYINNLGLPNAAVNADTPATGAPSQDTDLYTPGDQ